MIRDFFNGISSYGKALGLISSMNLWGYLILPGLIGLLLAAGIGGAAWFFYDDLGASLLSWIPWAENRWVSGFSNLLSALLILLLGLILFKYLLMIIVSPLMSPLSQKVAEKLTARKSAHSGFSGTQMIKDLGRGLHVALRNFAKEMLFSIPLLLLGFIPAIGIFSAGLLLLVQAYYAGFGNLDYTLERHFNVKQSTQFVNQHRGLAIGNGLVFILLLSSGIGIFFAPTLATIAGTLETVKHLEHTLPGTPDIDDFV